MTPLGPAAVSVSQAERQAWPAGRPSAARIAAYFAPAVRAGRPLGLTGGNWCAVGACWALAQVLPPERWAAAGVPHAYRAAGIELEQDARAAGRWRPPGRACPGDLVILPRGSESWQRHVSRVIRADATGWWGIDANGSGAAWTQSDMAGPPRPWSRALGVIAYPDGRGTLGAGDGLAVVAALAALGLAWAATG